MNTPAKMYPWMVKLGWAQEDAEDYDTIWHDLNRRGRLDPHTEAKSTVATMRSMDIATGGAY